MITTTPVAIEQNGTAVNLDADARRKLRYSRKTFEVWAE